jgi:hypothetical protein
LAFYRVVEGFRSVEKLLSPDNIALNQWCPVNDLCNFQRVAASISGFESVVVG